MVRVFAYVGAVAVLAVGLAQLVERAPEPAVAPERPAWTAVERPYRAFALMAPGLGDAEADYAIRRHARGGRKDILTVGGGDDGRSGLGIEIYRPGDELLAFEDSGEAIAGLALPAGQPGRRTAAETAQSKFGPIVLFDFAIGGNGSGRSCLGFAQGFGDPFLQIAGWYCRAAVEVVDRQPLFCAIEGLSLVAAGSDPKVQVLFAQAERRRRFCDARTVQRGSSARRTDWIETRREPELRGRIAAQ